MEAANTKPLYVIVVLGCAVNDDGTPTPQLAERIRAAAAYYFDVTTGGDEKSDAIVMPTGGAVKNQHVEAHVIRDGLVRDYGVPADDIVCDPHAFDTASNCQNCVRLMLEHERISPRRIRIVVVTSKFHVARGGLLMAGVLGTTHASPLHARLDYSDATGTLNSPALNDHQLGAAGKVRSFAPLHALVAAEDFHEGEKLAKREAWEIQCIAEQIVSAIEWDGIAPVVAPPNA
jgi:uncharacterized SAM-binding protein YcdF (DUF218 family)